MTLASLTWPLAQLGTALSALVRKSDPSSESAGLPSPPTYSSQDSLERWLEAAATTGGFELEPVTSPYADVVQLLGAASPALVQLPGEGVPNFLLLLRSRRQKVAVLGPDYRVHWIQVETVRAALCQELEAPLVDEIGSLLDEVEVPAGRRKRSHAAMLAERLSDVQVGGFWLLRLPTDANLWRQARHGGLLKGLGYLLGTYTLVYLLLLASWWVVGKGALQGNLDPGWLLAWALLLVTQVPLQALSSWLQGSLAVRAGGILKQHLLSGALRQEPEEIRRQGVGQLLGRVMEGNIVETLALSGGFLALIASVELVLAFAVLSAGAGGILQPMLLLGWLGVTLGLAWDYFRARNRWTETRLEMTHDLIEQMAGHRTRLAQEARENWHNGEDSVLERYLDLSVSLDRKSVVLTVFVPRGWLLVGLAGLSYPFITGTASTSSLAIGLGGILLAYLAFSRVATGFTNLIEAVIAWQQVAPLSRAAERSPLPGTFDATVESSATSEPSEGRSVVEALDLSFRYHPSGERVLRGCSLSVRAGERVLLEGSSGGGKSTLASLLTGLRKPESGLLLLEGFDHHTLGEVGWRKRIASAPQFHENHVLRGSFLFNLLMGRQWPPRGEDIEAALAVCHDLGLDDLLERMPGGIWQMVGETGWQLSHGERSRLYIARALLQRAEVIVLDESFAALDPENLERALRCVLERAPTLLVIAHP